MKTFEIITKSEQMTQEISTRLGKQLQAGDVLTLEGDLGAGKTTFTKGLALGLDITRNVTSPTFTIMKEYVGRLPLFHIDAYRLEHSEEDIGLEEYFYGEGVSVIEWATFIAEDIPADHLAITIEFIDETTRKLTLRPTNAYYKKLIVNSKIM